MQSIKPQERAVLCLLVECLCQNSFSYLHEWTRLIQNTEPVYAELKYSFLLSLITKVSARLDSSTQPKPELTLVGPHTIQAFHSPTARQNARSGVWIITNTQHSVGKCGLVACCKRGGRPDNDGLLGLDIG